MLSTQKPVYVEPSYSALHQAMKGFATGTLILRFKRTPDGVSALRALLACREAQSWFTFVDKNILEPQIHAKLQTSAKSRSIPAEVKIHTTVNFQTTPGVYTFFQEKLFAGLLILQVSSEK
jgi:hypothetical protein